MFGRRHRRVWAVVFGLLLMAQMFVTTAYAEMWPALTGTILSDGAILIDADSGAVLYGKNQDEAYYPASITKVMTAVIVLEQVENLDEMVTFSYDAVNTNLEDNATIIGAVAGDELSVRDCLYSLLLHSANDAANALAEHVAGTNEQFAALMNEKAAELGCTNTHFDNPSGLNSAEHYTSCSDMAKIMAYAIQNPQFRQIDQTQFYTHAPISRYPEADDPVNTVYAHHRMMRKNAAEYYDGVFAGKTGYTVAAGNTLVTACERDGMTLICVILNGHQSQYTDTKTLFDYGYANFASLSVNAYDQTYGSLSSNLGIDGIPLVDMLSLSIPDNNHVTLPKTISFDQAEAELSYDLSDEERGDGSVARISYRFEGRPVGYAYVQLLDESAQREAASAEARVMEAKVQETVPETIHMAEMTETQPATVAGQLPQETGQNHAPISIDRETGRLVIPSAIIQVVKILAAIGLLTLLVFVIYYLYERRTEYARKRRRARMLKHTRDLTRAQKARRDMLMYNRSRKPNQKRRR